jgi:minor extracellular protease Epr
MACLTIGFAVTTLKAPPYSAAPLGNRADARTVAPYHRQEPRAMPAIRLFLAALILCAGVLWDGLRDGTDTGRYVAAALADDDDDDGGSDSDDDDDNGGGSDSDDDDDNGGGSTGAGGTGGGPGSSDNDDDDGGSGSASGGGSNDDDDDDGGGSGSTSRNDDDDDDGGSTGARSGSRNDDDDDDGPAARGGSATRDQPATRTNRAAPRRTVTTPRVGAPLERFTLPRSDSDRARSAEISAANLSEVDLARLQQLGFRVIRSRQIAFFGGTLALRLRTPGSFTPQTALQIARQTVPAGIFDFSHLYNPGQGSAIYARDLVRISAAPGCGRGVRIGMIDTDVARHAALRGVRVTRRSFSEGRGDTRHGTAVASLLVGSDPSGGAVLDGAELFAASVFARGRSTLDADAIDVVAALDWLAGSGVKVVNVSITGPANTLLAAAVEAAAARGLLIVAAAGNGTAGGRPRYPAAYGPVIAVSAVDQRLRPYAFNTRGGHIDIAAPGVDVWAADAGGGGALWSGTSFAAPFVAVDLAIAARRGAVTSVNDARRHLAANARDIGAPGRDPVFGAGLLQSTGC